MSDAITVTCPNCQASLKLKNRNSVGKKVPCPKCKKPFVVKTPAAEEDDDLAFMNAHESDGAVPMAEEDEDEFAAALPTRSVEQSAGGRSKRGKRKASPELNWVKPLLIGTAALVVVGLLVGGGIVAVSMIGGMAQNKIDLTYLPSDADCIVHVRVDDALGSPFMQSLTANAGIKQALDQLTSSSHVPLSDVKSITMGASGVTRIDFSKFMTIPGMGPQPNTAALRGIAPVVVFRTSRDLPPDLMSKFPGFEKFDYGGKTYYRTPGASKLEDVCAFQVTPQVLVLANSVHMNRMIDDGMKQTRRPEFDFVDAKSQILVAALGQANSGGSAPPAGGPAGMSPGGMPGGMPGGPPGPMGANPVPALSDGKVKAWYLGISFTQDIEIQTGLLCPDSAADARQQLEQLFTKQKSDFAAQKAAQQGMLNMMGMGEVMPQIEAILNSLTVSGSGSMAQVNAKVPGAIKSSIEKAIPLLSGMAKAGAAAPGGPNPFGGQPPADAAGDGSPTTSGETSGTSNSGNTTPPQ